MFDALFKFTDEVAAKADLIIGKHWLPASDGAPEQWGNNLIPNVLVWDERQDVTDTEGNVTHAYDTTGWFCILPSFFLDPAVQSHPNLLILADREAASVGRPFVMRTVLSQDQLTHSHLSPLDAGSNYPFGGEI